MPTNRTRRTRTRRPLIDAEMEQFFITGEVVQDSPLLWDIFSNDGARIYEAWRECKDSLHRQYKKLLAWRVFETRGTVNCFPQFIWISRQGYQAWKNGQPL